MGRRAKIKQERREERRRLERLDKFWLDPKLVIDGLDYPQSGPVTIKLNTLMSNA